MNLSPVPAQFLGDFMHNVILVTNPFTFQQHFSIHDVNRYKTLFCGQ